MDRLRGRSSGLLGSARGGQSVRYVNIAVLVVTCVALAVAYGLFFKSGQESTTVELSGARENGDNILNIDIVTISQLPHLISAPAGVHGAVKKGKHVPQAFWGTTEEPNWEEQERRKAWVVKHELNQEPVGPGEEVLPVRCAVLVNHKYKVMYLRQYKTGTSTIMHFFKYCNKDATVPTCLAVKPKEDDDQVLHNWQDYLVFTFTRNPYARAGSAFKFLNNFVRASNIGDHLYKQDHCKLSFKQFCHNPRTLDLHCRLFPECCKNLGMELFLRHVDPQYRCMADADGDFAVDFIGREEHMEEDLGTLVDLINKRLPEGVEPLKFEGLSVANVASCDGQSKAELGQGEAAEPECTAVDKYGPLYEQYPECVHGLANYYHEDFQHLQFPRVTTS